MKQKGHLFTLPICLATLVFIAIHTLNMVVNVPKHTEADYAQTMQIVGTLMIAIHAMFNYCHFSKMIETSRWDNPSRFQQIIVGSAFVLTMFINMGIVTGLVYLTAYNAWGAIGSLGYSLMAFMTGLNASLDDSSRGFSMLGIGYNLIEYTKSLGKYVTDIEQKRIIIKEFYKTAKY